MFQAEDREEVDNMFYNQLTLDEIRENLQDFNCVIGEIKQILREVEDGNDNITSPTKTTFEQNELLRLYDQLKPTGLIKAKIKVRGKEYGTEA